MSLIIRYMHVFTYAFHFMKDVYNFTYRLLPLLLKLASPGATIDLKRALDEDTGVLSFFFSFLSSSPLAVSGNSMHPSSVILRGKLQE